MILLGKRTKTERGGLWGKPSRCLFSDLCAYQFREWSSDPYSIFLFSTGAA